MDVKHKASHCPCSFIVWACCSQVFEVSGAAELTPFHLIFSCLAILASSHLLNSLGDSSACFFAHRIWILMLFPSSAVLCERPWTPCPWTFLHFECSHLGMVPVNNSGTRGWGIVWAALSLQQQMSSLGSCLTPLCSLLNLNFADQAPNFSYFLFFCSCFCGSLSFKPFPAML